MSAPRDFSGESWRLKLKRAQKHLHEFDAKIADYLKREPYGARHVKEGDGKRHVWRYALNIREQPEQEVAVILGDVVHNLRSALDHLAVAIAPRDRRSSAGFPIEDPDAWTENASGIFVPKNEDAGERFLSKTQGIPSGALTVIEDLQPYWHPQPDNHPLRILSRLENADKHRNLIPMLAGLNDAQSVMFRRGVPVNAGWDRPGFSEDGAIIADHTFPPSDIPDESEVEVKVGGIATIAIRVGGEIAPLALWRVSNLVTHHFPYEIFDRLEPFVPTP